MDGMMDLWHLQSWDLQRQDVSGLLHESTGCIIITLRSLGSPPATFLASRFSNGS